MVIAKHHGPSGQIFYRNHSPKNHPNPARFDSLQHGLFPYYFEHKQLGWKADVIYVTDYSKFYYEVATIKEKKYIETSAKPETFSRAEDVIFVVGSDVSGAMGPDFIPFSDRQDARAFIDKHGGTQKSLDEITQDLLIR